MQSNSADFNLFTLIETMVEQIRSCEHHLNQSKQGD